MVKQVPFFVTEGTSEPRHFDNRVEAQKHEDVDRLTDALCAAAGQTGLSDLHNHAEWVARSLIKKHGDMSDLITVLGRYKS